MHACTRGKSTAGFPLKVSLLPLPAANRMPRVFPKQQADSYVLRDSRPLRWSTNSFMENLSFLTVVWRPGTQFCQGTMRESLQGRLLRESFSFGRKEQSCQRRDWLRMLSCCVGMRDLRYTAAILQPWDMIRDGTSVRHQMDSETSQPPLDFLNTWHTLKYMATLLPVLFLASKHRIDSMTKTKNKTY